MLVLDPYLLVQRPGETPAIHAARVSARLKELIRICKTRNYKLVVDSFGWNYLELNLISKLKSVTGNPELATSLNIIRKNYLDRRGSFSLVGGRTWGVKPLYNNFKSADDAIFGEFVAKSVGHTMNSQVPAVYLFVENIIGRNATQHGAQPSTITERTRWRIYVAYSGYAVARVPCITNERNIAVPWTCRFEQLLPDTGTYAFVPPENWELKATKVIETQYSKAVWIDRFGNGWARPSTPPPGLPEHWDVYLQAAWVSMLKLNQVNITRYGINDAQLIPGEIHHVPTGKAHILQA